jgi:hypothetical protein
MRSSPLFRRGLAVRVLVLAPSCVLVLGGLVVAPTGALTIGVALPAAMRVMTGVTPAAASRVMPDGTLIPLASANVIRRGSRPARDNRPIAPGTIAPGAPARFTVARPHSMCPESTAPPGKSWPDTRLPSLMLVRGSHIDVPLCER